MLGKNRRHFEVRSVNKENCYKLGSLLNVSMGRLSQLTDIEYDQQFDYILVKRLAKILEFLPNIED
jgi:hypothetical protein